MAEIVLTNGCQCGAVRFRVAKVRQGAAICHCRMCQKAFGNYFAPLVMVDGVEWTRGAPTYFRSSNLACRGFCANCGTPLCYLEDSGAMEIAGGALDNPDLVPPTVQYVLKDKLALFDTLSAVPHQPHVDKEAAGLAMVISQQHLDHDTDVWPLRENTR
jgi:hypothetical protein